jgi:fructose-bisphosphate aldolase class II
MQGHYAVASFNILNLEMIQGILEAAVEERSPVIVAVSQKGIDHAGLEQAAEMVKVAARLTPVPVVLHLDHGRDFRQAAICLGGGFTSLMIDGSALPFDENVAISRRVVEMAHAFDVPVEAELGRIAGKEDDIIVSDSEAAMTDPQEARRFVELTGVDWLSVAVGSVHLLTTRTAQLDLERISAIKEAAGIPLVLHGGSGIPDEAVQEAIARGICKINIATHVNRAFLAAMSRALAANSQAVDPREILDEGRQAIKEAVREKLRLFGSSGKA